MAVAAAVTDGAAVLIFRYNNPDALLTLLLVGSAYAFVRGLESDRIRWLSLAGVLTGVAFETKLLQGFLVLPVFAIVYAIAGRGSARRRIAGLAVAAVAVVIASSWWVVAMELIPAASRAYTAAARATPPWTSSSATTASAGSSAAAATTPVPGTVAGSPARPGSCACSTASSAARSPGPDGEPAQTLVGPGPSPAPVVGGCHAPTVGRGPFRVRDGRDAVSPETVLATGAYPSLSSTLFDSEIPQMRNLRIAGPLLALGLALAACSGAAATPAPATPAAATPVPTTAAVASTAPSTAPAATDSGADRYGGGGTPAPGGALTIDLATTGLGKVLADGSGMTLYVFLADSGDKSACSGSCATNWPPLTGTKPKAGAGLDDSDFGSITRSDGARQVTFYGQPLYSFAGDSAAGQTNGQGFGGKWYVVGNDGKPIK